MTLDDITYVFAYRRDKLQDLDGETRSHNWAVSSAIVEGFTTYGWSLSGLLNCNTKVMKILKSYLRPKRPHADDGPGNSVSRQKRWRVDRSGASASLPDHDFLASSLASGKKTSSQVTYITNAMEATLGSKDRTRDLIDSATASNLVHAVKSPDVFSDPVTIGNLGHAVNSSDEIIDLAVADFLGSNGLTDPSTERFLREATSQLYFGDDSICPSMNNISSLPNGSTLGYIDPRKMVNSTASSTLGRMDC